MTHEGRWQDDIVIFDFGLSLKLMTGSAKMTALVNVDHDTLFFNVLTASNYFRMLDNHLLKCINDEQKGIVLPVDAIQYSPVSTLTWTPEQDSGFTIAYEERGKMIDLFTTTSEILRVARAFNYGARLYDIGPYNFPYFHERGDLIGIQVHNHAEQ